MGKTNDIQERELEQSLQDLQAGNLEGAHRRAKGVLQSAPNNADAHHLLGVIAREKNCLPEAIGHLEKAQALEPANIDILQSLGMTHQALQQHEAAVSTFEQILEISPGQPSVLTCLGNSLRTLNRLELALVVHEQAVLAAPESPEIWSNIASTYLACGSVEASIQGFQHALELRPEWPELHYNLGTAFQKAGNTIQAAQSFGEAINLGGKSAGLYTNFGTVLKELGELDEAHKFLITATKLAPDYADAHWNLSLLLLLQGNYEEGWKEYEWRKKIPSIKIQQFSKPEWDGSAQPGKTLLIHAEQGIGDTFQFIRYVNLAKPLVGAALFLCRPSLARVLRNAKGVDNLVTTEEELPDFDIHTPLISLPLLLGTTDKASIPRDVPYLTAEEDLSSHWEKELQGANQLKVGICWQGNPNYNADAQRSIPLDELRPIIDLKTTRVISLQKIHGLDQLEKFSGKEPIENLGPRLDENTGAFVDTAAVISNLDLIITSDTAMAHLAGALGAKTWLLLPKNADWRWGDDTEQTAWYPTMQLFRQEEPEDWAGVVQKVCDELKRL